VSWSRLVTSPAEAVAALADPGDALDLRAQAELDDGWRAQGFTGLVPGVLVRPVPLVLDGVARTRALGVRLASAPARPRSPRASARGSACRAG
jgi:hypothetical protein